MALDIKELGLSTDELCNRVVERICEQLLCNVVRDEDDETYRRPSCFEDTLKKLVMERINYTVQVLAEQHILPKVATYVETLTLQETNKWGEKTGKSMTFVEYLVQRAEYYLREEVNYEGKSRDESGNYGWNKSQTRITYLVHKHLQYSIDNAMKEAVKNVNSALAKGLEETVKMKLAEISQSLKVSVQTK